MMVENYLWKVKADIRFHQRGPERFDGLVITRQKKLSLVETQIKKIACHKWLSNYEDGNPLKNPLLDIESIEYFGYVLVDDIACLVSRQPLSCSNCVVDNEIVSDVWKCYDNFDKCPFRN